MHPQEFSAADSLHSRAVDGQWGVVTILSINIINIISSAMHYVTVFCHVIWSP